MTLVAPSAKLKYLEENVTVPMTPEVRVMLEALAAKCNWAELKALVERINAA